MNFRRKRLVKHYQAAWQPLKQHLYKRPYILPLLGLLAGIAVVAGFVLTHDSQTLKPSDSHVVFLSESGKKQQTLNTKAATVGQLLDRLPLRLIPQDVVEPSRDTPIVEDSFRINVYRARPVTVVDDNSIKTVYLTAQMSPRVVAEDAGLSVFAEDSISFTQGNIKQNILGERVVVKRATPVVLNLYGTQLNIRTQSQTVADLLTEKSIKVASGDIIQPAPNTLITPNIQVFIIRQGTQIATVEEPIPPPIQNVQDSRLTFGITAVRQKGKPGKKAVTYQIQTKNGVEIGRQVIQTVVIVQPVPRIIAVGSSPLGDSLQTWLLKLRNCESHGNYQANTGNGYYGAYQFAVSTWNRLNTGYPRADLAPPSVQDQGVITNTVRSSGGLASQHPGCYRKLGLSQFPPPNR